MKKKTPKEIMAGLVKAGLVKDNFADPTGEITKHMNAASRRAQFGPACEDAQTAAVALQIHFLQTLQAKNKNGALDAQIESTTNILAPDLARAVAHGKIASIAKAVAEIGRRKKGRGLKRACLLEAYAAAFRLERFPTVAEVRKEFERIIADEDAKGATVEGIEEDRTFRWMITVGIGLPTSPDKVGRRAD